MIKLRCFNWERVYGEGCWPSMAFPTGRKTGKRLYLDLWVDKKDIVKIVKKEKTDYYIFFIGKAEYKSDDNDLPRVLGLKE